jgi:hypothetical protein
MYIVTETAKYDILQSFKGFNAIPRRRAMQQNGASDLLVVKGFEKVNDTKYEEGNGTSKSDCRVLAWEFGI